MKDLGRVCVFPLAKFSSALAVANFTHHQWAERARRQDAFGLATTPAIIDFKSPKARAELGLQWFEFPITSTDYVFFHSKYVGLISTADDPSAGFIRHEITEYVEAHGKFSPALTNWLLERIPVVPRCYRLKAFDGAEVVVNHELPTALGVTEFASELSFSRKYWSREFPDSSWDRMRDWSAANRLGVRRSPDIPWSTATVRSMKVITSVWRQA